MTTADEMVTVPASSIQEQMWLNEMLRGADTVYTMAEVLRVEGELDAARLSTAVASLQERHEALRTTFEGDGTVVRQVIHPAYPVPVVTHALNPQGDHEREFRALLDGVLVQPFALDRPPLWRCLVGTTGTVTYLAVVMHHIVADGWSIGILVDELGTLYAGAEPARNPRPYREFSREQRDWLEGEEAARSVRHWQRELADTPVTTSFPGPGRRTTHRGERIGFPFSPGTQNRVAKVAAAAGVTPYMLYLAVYAIVLARRGGARDLVIGIPAANRTDEKDLGTVGLFVNPLPLRLRLPASTTLRATVAAVRDAVLGIIEHQALPFSAVVKAAGVGRDAGPSPLFQTMVAQRTDRVGYVKFASHRAERLLTSTGTAKYDLTATFPDDDDDGLGLIIEFDLGRYDARYVRGVADEYLRTLDLLLADSPDTEIPLVAQEPEISGFVPIHRLFRQVVRSRPNGIAVVQGTDWYTYAELDERSALIAAELRGMGVAVGSVVGIRLSRGLDFVAVAVAVLRLGAAYLPTDDRWPHDRLRLVLHDARAEVLVVAGDPGAAAEGGAGTRVLALAGLARRAAGATREPGAPSRRTPRSGRTTWR